MQPADKTGVPVPTTPTPAPTVTTAGPSVSSIGPVTPPPDTARMKALSDKLVAQFPSTKVDYLKEKRLKVTVPPSDIKAVSLFARDSLGFDHLNVVGGTDYIAQSEFEVVYFVGSLSIPGQQDLVLQIAERVKRDDSATVPSLVEVWTAAEYHERETFEMLGIKFDGHPDLRRLLLPEDWDEIPPLRKDYVNPGR